MNTTYGNSETGCCPKFDPTPWDNKEHHWQGKLFIKDRVRTFFYMPIGFGKVVCRNMAMIEKADALTAEPLMLSHHNSKWNMELYIAVTKEVPGAENVRLSGTFLSRAFEGPYRDTGKWCKQMANWVKFKGKAIKTQFMFYTTCPKCAKHYGKNYVVILAEV